MTDMLTRAFRITRAYVVVLAAIALLGSTPAAVGCGSRTSKSLSDDAQDTTQGNLTWVKTQHPIYVAIRGRGVFRLNLNSKAPEPLGIHKDVAFYDFKIAPSGRYLLYQVAGAGSESSYVYDLDRKLEQQIFGLPQYSHITASPNDRWLAAIPRPGEPPVVQLLNLKDGKLKQFAVPKAGENAFLFGSNWSTESNLLFGLREKSAEIFWRLAPDTGVCLQVKGAHTASFQIAYYEGSNEVRTVCETCSTQHSLSTARVAGGIVVATRYSLIFRDDGMPDRTIVSLPTPPDPAPGQPMVACGPEGIRLEGVFDDEYLLFSDDQLLKLYSITENRTALLPIPPYSLIAWQ